MYGWKQCTVKQALHQIYYLNCLTLKGGVIPLNQLPLLNSRQCCDMSQNDTIGKIELNPSIILSSDNTNCKNDIQLFHQLFDELSVRTDYH